MDPVTLRPAVPDDVPVFFEHQLDPEATRMAAFPSRDRDAHRAHWEKILADDACVTMTVVAGTVVAGNMLSWVDGDKREIGYWIGREHWGRGIASAALPQLLELLTERPLYAYVAEHNAGSARVLEKSGFTQQGAERGDAGVTLLVYVLER